MFVVVYRWRVKAGTEEAFVAAWRERTEEIYTNYGSLGSRLHRAADGTWVAYAQWPDRDTRERASSAAGESESLRVMRQCVVEVLPEMHLEVVADLLR